MEKIKIGIGIPAGGSIKMETVKSLIESLSEGIPSMVILVKGSIIPANRTTIISNALDNQCTHVFFLDSDMELQKGTLSKLLGHKKEIVSVNCNRKGLPLDSVVKLLEENDGKMPDNLFECKSVGLACTLIDLKIFEFIPRPWFVIGYEGDNITTFGEDDYFCKKARDSGYKIWCDPTLKTGHIGDYVY